MGTAGFFRKRSSKKNFLGGIKIYKIWRKRHSEELMRLFGDLDTRSLVRIRRLNWIDHVNRKDSNGEVSQVFNSNFREVD